MRRRLRFLRRLRELGYRDLGGLVFEQHRFARADEALVRGKVDALAAVDRELRALEAALGERRAVTELREPGLTACARCGAVIGSDARFCSSCGAPPRRRARRRPASADGPAGRPAAAPAPQRAVPPGAAGRADAGATDRAAAAAPTSRPDRWPPAPAATRRRERRGTPAPSPVPAADARSAAIRPGAWRCGAAARTRLVPTPGWRAPIVIAATVGALAVAAWPMGLRGADRGRRRRRTGPQPTTAPAP